jgi:hypothetical protein
MALVLDRRNREPSTSDSERWLDWATRKGYLQPVQPTTRTGFIEYGPGALFLPAQTNYVTNPTAATTGWTGLSGLTVTRETTAPVAFPPGISTCCKIVHGAVDYGAFQLIPKFAVVAGEVYTGSAFVHMSEELTTDRIYVAFRTYLGADVKRDWYLIAAYVSDPNTSFARISKSVTIAADEDGLEFSCWTDTGTSTGYVTGFMVEKSAVLTPYFDGSTHDCVWTGAANASTSTRAGSDLQVSTGLPSGLQTAGTFAGRLVPLWAANDGAFHSCGILWADANGSISFYKASTNFWTVSCRGGGASNTTTISAGASAAGTAHVVTARWTQGGAGTIDLMVDGTAAAQGAQAKTLAAPTTFYIGRYQDGTQPVQAYLGPIAVCPARITDAETALLSTMLTAGCTGACLAKWFRDKSYVNTLIIPLEGSCTAFRVVA